MKRSIVAFLEYLFMFFLIIEFNTPYMYFPFIRKAVYLLLFVVLLGLNLSRMGKIKIDFLILAILLGTFLPSLNVAEGQFLRFFRMYVLFLSLLVLYLVALFKEGRDRVYSLFLKYSNIVSILATISLSFWFLGSILEIIPYTTVIPNSWGRDKFIPTYYGIYFETQEAMATAGQESAMIRNSGIFNEAPMHNMILCVAIAIEIFLRPKLSKTRVLILVVTIFSTISTTGVIFLVILLSGKFVLAMNTKRRSIMILCIPIALLLSVWLVSALLDNKKETGEGSYNSRSRDIVRCIEVGLENPILGVEIFHKADEVGGTEASGYGYSNSLFAIFAHGGFYMWILYLLPLFIMPLLCYKRDKDIHILGVMMCYFLLFTFTNSHYKYLTLLFIGMGLSYWDMIFYAKNIKARNIS